MERPPVRFSEPAQSPFDDGQVHLALLVAQLELVALTQRQVWRISTRAAPERARNGASMRFSEPATAFSTDKELLRGRASCLDPLAPIVVKNAADGEKASDYKGQYRIWPGVLLLVLMVVGATYGIVTNAETAYEARVQRAENYELTVQGSRAIKDNKTEDNIVSDDGQVGNPKSYDLDVTCELPDYQSKNGQIVAVAANGTEVPLQIKGINWFGMETKLASPFGLWENQMNGTTAYEIASFLSRNNFNAVRIPISVENVNNNNPPMDGIINLSSNRALNTTNFISTLQSIVKALAYRKIGVLISMHTLTNAKSGNTWFDESLGVTQDDFLAAVGTVSSNLCGEDYWNVMGLDLKNEPQVATWGTGDDDDFVVGCEKIANVMHTNCPKWMGFVEGVVGSHSITLDGTKMSYYDWWGGGLQKAGDAKPQFTIENKLVWAPHYYTTAVSPQMYFYGDGTTSDYSTYVELDDDALYSRIEATMEDMFGYLVEENAYALLLGEFAGLYTKDAHPQKTTKRTTDQTIQVMLNKNYAGGFMWSLNPESSYAYNPANVEGSFTEGLLEDDWITPNGDFLNAFLPLDAMPNLRKFPCFVVNEDDTR